MDWGLGHATRCIPIIEYLLQKNAQVILAGNGNSLSFLIDYFPQLRHYTLADYNIHYSPNRNAALQSLLQLPKIRQAIQQEHQQVADIVQQENINIILSDNRYGVYNKNCINIFMCHQIALQAPKPFGMMNALFLKMHLQFIKQFNYLFIPDIATVNNLSGILSHDIDFPIPHFYIGWMSRFMLSNNSAIVVSKQYDIVVLLSGVEPLRTNFEQSIIEQLKQLDKRCLIIRGLKQDTKLKSLTPTIDAIDYVHQDALYHYLNTTEIIICRSGYSTVMDLALLGKKAIYVPTPGQTEQEYLAKRLSDLKMGIVQEQNQLQIKIAIQKLEQLNEYLPYSSNFDLLDDAISVII